MTSKGKTDKCSSQSEYMSTNQVPAPVSTKELLTKYGDRPYKDGDTYQEAWDKNDSGSARYTIRIALLKLYNVDLDKFYIPVE